MSEAKIAKAWGTACVRQVLIASTILIIFTAVAIGLVALSLSLPITPDQRSMVIFIGIMLALVMVLAGIMIWGISATRRRSARLDAAFRPFGLLGKAYLLTGRQYHGIVGGRQVDAYVYRGPSLDLYISSALHTRMGIGQKNNLKHYSARMTNLPKLTIDDPSITHLAISSLDPRWGRELLELPSSREIILGLVAIQPGFEFRNVLFQPEAIQLQVYMMNPGTLTSENLRLWMDDLFKLVNIAESLPAPVATSTASAMEQRARSNRSEFALPVLGISCAVLFFFGALIILAIIGVLNLGKVGL